MGSGSRPARDPRLLDLECLDVGLGMEDDAADGSGGPMRLPVSQEGWWIDKVIYVCTVYVLVCTSDIGRQCPTAMRRGAWAARESACLLRTVKERGVVYSRIGAWVLWGASLAPIRR
jgi:hypothetical protein